MKERKQAKGGRAHAACRHRVGQRQWGQARQTRQQGHSLRRRCQPSAANRRGAPAPEPPARRDHPLGSSSLRRNPGSAYSQSSTSAGAGTASQPSSLWGLGVGAGGQLGRGGGGCAGRVRALWWIPSQIVEPQSLPAGRARTRTDCAGAPPAPRARRPPVACAGWRPAARRVAGTCRGGRGVRSTSCIADRAHPSAAHGPPSLNPQAPPPPPQPPVPCQPWRAAHLRSRLPSMASVLVPKVRVLRVMLSRRHHSSTAWRRREQEEGLAHREARTRKAMQASASTGADRNLGQRSNRLPARPPAQAPAAPAPAAASGVDP